VWGEELFFDATKIRANADVDTLVPRFYWRAKQHLEELFSDAPAAAPSGSEEQAPPERVANDATPPPSLPVPLTAAENEVLAAENAARWPLLDHRRLDPERPAAGPYQRATDRRVSPTDPDAALMHVGGHAALGYHDHYVVDGGKARIILHAVVTPADVMENTPMLDLVRRVRFRWKLRPKRAVGDTAYGTGENLQGLAADGIRAYVPLPDWGKNSPFFSQRDFTYDSAQDVYRCPQGTVLRLRGNNYVTGVGINQAPTATCQACPVRSSVPIAARGGSSTVRSTRSIGSGSVSTTARKPTPRRCGNARCGSSRCSGKPSSGTAYASSACAAWRTSIWKRYWSPRDRTSNAGS
jgi:hypothetical protein